MLSYLLLGVTSNNIQILISQNFTISKKITICTGTLIADFFQENFIPLFKSFSSLDIQLIPIVNTFFGEQDVTLSGLLPGQDIIAQ